MILKMFADFLYMGVRAFMFGNDDVNNPPVLPNSCGDFVEMSSASLCKVSNERLSSLLKSSNQF